MLLTTPRIDRDELERRTGWTIKPEGACKGDICVPLPAEATVDGQLDARVFAERMRMPLVHDEAHGVWALGPASGGRALSTADVPDITLPDLDGNDFALRSLRGKKVVLAAWASW